MKYNALEFYPTPESVLDKMTTGIDWKKASCVLEPSAGKGDIADYVQDRAKIARWNNDVEVDCIEIDDELRSTLKGKGYRVVHDDFLTFNTFKKYDLIIMNPPFSNGAAHLLKALDMQKDGGAVVCILNAETLKNPYSNERKELCKRLQELNAEITYVKDAFVSSEHPTGVEIAIIRAYIEEKEFNSQFYDEMKQQYYSENIYDEEMTELAPNDFIKAAVAMYNREVSAGVKLIHEYQALVPRMLNSLRDNKYSQPILTMKIGNKDLSVNRYIRCVREKYWDALFKNPKFTGTMTSNLSSQYCEQVKELRNYDFSVYNIKCLQLEMSKNLVRGIEDCIIELFDKLSHQHAYDDELKNNIHYYNGWKTNKCWYINKKVIIPWVSAFSKYSGKFDPDYYVRQRLADIEKALNYLDGGLTECRDMEKCLNNAVREGQTKKIELKYFFVTFYKKGTCHLEFKDEELLKKLNIFGAQNKRWLPPGYGKKHYSEMDVEEKAVIDEFEGKESYEKVLVNADYYIYNPVNSIPMIETTDLCA